MDFEEQFIDEISQVTPNSNVTDENINIPLQELQHNIKYLANLISNINASVQTGNLLNYDSNGSQTSTNGGSFETFENKNSWLAVENTNVVNDTKINTEIPLDALIWNGLASTVESGSLSTSWLEREFAIPQQLRGMELTFAIKGTGINFIPTESDYASFVNGEIPYCDRSTESGINQVGVALCVPYTAATSSQSPSGIGTSGTSGTSGTPNCNLDLENKCFARYEDILIEVIGANVTTPFAVTLGPWPNHKYYAQNPLWAPAYRTVAINFVVPVAATSIKIKIHRTRSDGAIVFSNMFFGSLPSPYETYDFENIDINELYNFKYGIVKLNATSVLGHHVAKNKTSTVLSNLLTKEQVLHVQQFNKDIKEFDWDQISGPRHIELNNNSESSPKLSVFEFDPDFTRYLHFNMKVDGPDPGMGYMGISYFVNENEFSGNIDCNISDSNCNPISLTPVGEINLNTLPLYGDPGTLDTSGNPTLNCVRKEIIDNRYVYTYYLPQIISGKVISFILGGFSKNNPSLMDPSHLEEYRNKWHFDSTDGNNINLNTVCLMDPYTRIGYTINEGAGQTVNMILPQMPENTNLLKSDDPSPCRNIKIDIYSKIVNPGDDGNPDFEDFNKTTYVIPVPKYITEGKMGYFEIYDSFFKDLSSNRGSIVYFTISRDGSHPLDTFGGNFMISSLKVGIANPPDDKPITRQYNLIKSDC